MPATKSVPKNFKPSVRLDLDKLPQNREPKPITQKDLDRHSRRQGEESRSEGKVLKTNAKGGKIMAKGKMADKMGRAMKNKSADAMGRAMKKYAKGGSVSSRADGCAAKGKTSTKHVTMRKGGSC